MPDLARVRLTVGGTTITRNVGAAYAKAQGMTALDEPTHNPDGSQRREERTSARSGRPSKKKTSVASAAAKKAVTRDERSAVPTEEESK